MKNFHISKLLFIVMNYNELGGYIEKQQQKFLK